MLCDFSCSAAVVLEFDDPTYTVVEGDSITVTVVRRGSSQVPTGFSVTLSTQDGSATGVC